MNRFVLKAPYSPSGDQPQAIEALARGFEQGMQSQVLLGVTGSGKTFTMASVIERVQRPTLVIAHNKTLAAQLCSEFRAFFPDSRVEYFVSYYDYYQPEAYIASSDTYIEKDASINDEIDRLRHSATAALRERRHPRPADPQGRDHRGFGELYLLHGRPQRVRGADDLPAPGHDHGPGRPAAQAHRDSV